jgi:acyl-CoA synthetase (AMP-forming)/AMP-acid ligase II
MTPGQATGLVHGPLADWAAVQPEAIAIGGTPQSLSFAQLHHAVLQRCTEMQESRAAATVLVDNSQPLAQRLVEFLALIASGRCAAMADPDWPAAVHSAVQAALPDTPCDMTAPTPTSAFYVGYTSGSSGSPKGFRRHHQSWVESFKICLQTFGPDAAARILVPGRDSHSLFLFAMLLGLWSGGGVVVQERFSAAAALQTLGLGQTPCLVAVPSQLILMLEVAQHRALPSIAGLRLILISGARWMRSRTAELRALFPQARIVEFYGASETSFVAWMDSDSSTPADVVGRPFANVELQIRSLDDGETGLRASADSGTGGTKAEDAAGLIYVRSPMLFMDYVGAASDASAALRDGDWLSVRDLGRLDAQGRLCLAGRQSRMLVTQGKNLFAEELEAVLEAHPAIAAASVQGLDDARRGARVVALLRWADDHADARPQARQLGVWCRERLEAFKAPRAYFVCHDWPLTASGKTDHPRLAQWLHRQLDNPLVEPPCLIPLP